METVFVYLDILFCYNFMINLLLLFLVAYSCSVSFSLCRGLVAAAVGSLYLCALCTVSYSFLEHLCFKTIVSAFMVFTAFSVHSFRTFFKLFILYYLMSFLLAGGIRFSQNFFFGSGFQISLLAVLIGILFIFLFAPAYVGMLRNKSIASEKIFQLTYNGKQLEFRGFSDTGNTLTEPIEHLHVIVVKGEKLKEIADFSQPEMLKNIRLIPCKTVTEDNGMLYGFKPDSLLCDEKPLRAVVAASDSLNTEEYDAVFHPLLLLS